jgi:ankyrin repeat protein
MSFKEALCSLTNKSIMETPSDIDNQLIRIMTDPHYADYKKALPLFERGADPNLIIDDDGTTPLMVLAAELRFELVESFVQAGADIAARDNMGETAIVRLCTGIWNWGGIGKDTDKTLDALLAVGTDIHVRDNNGFTPFLIAATTRFPGTGLRLLLDRGANRDDVSDLGYNALHLAANRSDFSRMSDLDTNAEAIHFLLSTGVDGELIASDNQTPLVVAIKSSNYPAAQTLLDFGVSPICPPEFAPYDTVAAAILGDIDRLREMSLNQDISNENKLTLLMWASAANQTDVVSYLLNQGADIHAVDIDGWDALMYAVDRAHEKTIALLLARGANQNRIAASGRQPYVNLPSPGDHTALSWALECSYNRGDSTRQTYFTVCHQLLAHGDADLSLVSTYTAMQVNFPEILRLRAAQGHDVMLTHVIGIGDIELLRSLLARDNFSYRTTQINSALLEAANRNQLEAAKILIGAGADVNDFAFYSPTPETPLLVAAGKGYEAMVRLLLQAGAKNEHTERKGLDASAAARKNGYEAIATLIEETAKL